nr:T9SS type A sorting domain-containing protein [Bacteroidota bacterium]
MKKLSFLLIGILTSLLIFSQEYYPFPDSNAIWNKYSIHVEYPQSVAYKIRYGTIGDTMIDNMEYSKIYRLIDDTCLNISNSEYFGAIREENKKIYTITTYHGDQEILLYDFSKQVGDTIFSNSPEGYMAYPVIISSIDTIELNDGSNRRRYWLEGGYYSLLTECWIEGFGSIHGLFTPLFDLITNYYEPHLSCFKQNGNTVYLNNYSCDKCFCSLGTSINEISEIQIQVYPNPFSDQIIIESKNECSEIRIYNSKGKIIQTFNTITFPTKFDLGKLPVGLYLIQMIGKDFSCTEKLLKK